MGILRVSEFYEFLYILLWILQDGKRIFANDVIAYLFNALFHNFGYRFWFDSPNYMSIIIHGGSLEGVLVMRYFCDTRSFGELTQLVLK